MVARTDDVDKPPLDSLIAAIYNIIYVLGIPDVAHFMTKYTANTF